MSDKGTAIRDMWVIGDKSWLEGETENEWPRTRASDQELKMAKGVRDYTGFDFGSSAKEKGDYQTGRTEPFK